MRVRPIAVFATSMATPRRVAIELRGGALFVELTTTALTTVPVRASRPHQLHLRGRGSEDKVVDVALHTNSRSRGLRDELLLSTASRQRSRPVTWWKVFSRFLTIQLEF